MTQDEALKLARDALEALENISTALREDDVLGSDIELMLDAITTIRETLAQPEQEPVAWEQFHEHLVERNFCPRCGKRTADPATIHTCTPPLIDPNKWAFDNGLEST